MSDDVLVSVIVPVLDEERHLERALEHALGQEGLDGELEVLVVDGGSRDRTRSIAARIAAADPRVRLLDNPDRLIPHALNVGLRAARGEFVARMDAHTWYPPGYLAVGVARLRRGDVAQVSGPQLAEGDGTWSRRVALALTTKMGMGGATYRAAGAEREVDSGFTGMWRRATLEAHEGWDERWHVNEDGELAARVRAAGGRIVCVPEMAASYVPRDSLRGLGRQYWRYGQYRARTCLAHPETMRRSHALPPAFVALAATAVLPGRIGSPGRLAVAAWSAAAVAASASVAGRDGVTPADLATLPAIFATMHVSWGAGFVRGSARFGPPVEAFLRVAGVKR
ncbi:MAG TPA: glycosyltransferase family 2 protein [Solirubrobacteraceae bacterium]